MVRLFVCVGNRGKTVPVNLLDRGQFSHDLLIGGSFLKNGFLVDAGRRFSVEPGCSGAPP